MNLLNSRTRFPGLIAAVAAAGLVLSACGSGADSDQAQTPAAAVAPAPAAPVADARPDADTAAETPAAVPVPAALQFTAASVSGGTVEGAALLTKPTVAWFWAPWCSICRAEAPNVAAAQARFGDQVNFVGIAGRGPVEDMARFVADTDVGAFEHAVDADGGVWSGFKVISQPSFAFIHPDGSIETVTGSLGAKGLEKRIADLMNA